MTRLFSAAKHALPALSGAIGFGLLSLHPLPALAGYADDLTELLADPSIQSLLTYGSIEETVTGGVAVTELQITAAGLEEFGLPVIVDGSGGPSIAVDPDAVAVRIARLHMNAGALGLLLGLRGGGQPESIGIDVNGLTIDLATLAHIETLNLLRDYLGDMATLSGNGGVLISQGSVEWHDIEAHVSLDDVGWIGVDLQFNEGNGSPPRGELVFLDGENRRLIGLLAFLHRLPLEMEMRFAEEALAMTIAEAEDDPDAAATLIEIFEADLAAAEAELLIYPEDGMAMADALAVWAEEMAAALPRYEAVFRAVREYGDVGGQLRLTLAPGGELEVPMDAAFEPATYRDADLIGAVFDALGMEAIIDPVN